MRLFCWDLPYLQPLTPLHFILCLNNLEVSGVHPVGLLLGERQKEKKKNRLQHLRQADNSSLWVFLGCSCRCWQTARLTALTFHSKHCFICWFVFFYASTLCLTSPGKEVWHNPKDVKTTSVLPCFTNCSVHLCVCFLFMMLFPELPVLHRQSFVLLLFRIIGGAVWVVDKLGVSTF